jgi:hypothetical protein
VLYIMGSGRSGTTLLGSILGEYPDTFAAGEVSYLWERGILSPRGCGCGSTPMECAVWGEVISRLAGNRDPRDLATEQLAHRRSIRLRHTRQLLRGPTLTPPANGRANGTQGAVDAYATVLRDVYRVIADVTGSRLIVDTSKHPADAAIVARMTGVDHSIIHVVRDSRAVTHSWRRRKEGIARRKTVLAALDWQATNLAADDVRRHHGATSMLIRYEDLMEAPRQHVEAITGFAGISMTPTPFVDDDTVALRPNHTISGNPARFVAGATTIRLDDRWQQEMRPALRRMVTILTATGLRRYRYPLRLESGRR